MTITLLLTGWILAQKVRQELWCFGANLPTFDWMNFGSRGNYEALMFRVTVDLLLTEWILVHKVKL